MVRLPEITSKEDLPEEAQHIFDVIAQSRGGVRGPFALLLHSPEVAQRVAHLGTYVRFESVLSPVDRELAILTTARECDCEYQWSGHTRLARQAGVREEAINVIAQRLSLDQLTEAESFIVGYARELIREHRVSDAKFEAARIRCGDQGIIDLTVLIGYYAMVACVLNALEIKPRYPIR